MSGVRIGIFGAGGRMGRELIATISHTPGALLGGAVEAADHACVGQPLSGGLVICSNPRALAHACDVLVDFTVPAALKGNLDAACAARRAIVIGTTGLTAADQHEIENAARHIAVLQAANTSLGVAVLAALVEQAAARVPWAAEILELHHGGKADAPSGTALALGEAVARGRGQRASVPKASRAGVRAPDEVGFASLRGGTAVGDHMVMFLGEHERLELTHRAESRAVFAKGAVAAALWLHSRPPGRYAMRDMLSAPPAASG